MRKSMYLVSMIGIFILLTGCRPSPKQSTTPPISSPSAPTQNSTVSPTISPDSPTSTELIDTALQNGEIDQETALTYKVFSVFQDPRLPIQYKGSPDNKTDSHILDDIPAQFTSISSETQQTLLPFLMPPIYKGSWADPNFGDIPPEKKAENASRYAEYGLPCNEIDMEGWEYKQAMHSPVRVWWSKARPEDSQEVDALIAAIDDQIWPQETTLMGHTPQADGGTNCDGGSPDLDVYVSSMLDSLGLTVKATNRCQDTPTFIIIRSDQPPNTLAHEFMHAIQAYYPLAKNCQDYKWLKEATATWVEDYIYPSINSEQEYVESFYDPSSEPTLPLYEKDGTHQYGAYLFFFYLTHHFNQPEIVSRAWANSTSTGSVEAVDLAIPEGIKSAWEDFAIENIIEPPYDDYQVWDNLNIKPSGKSMVAKGKTTPNGLFLQAEKSILPLSIQYYWYTFTDEDSLVTFFNGLSYDLGAEPMAGYTSGDMLGVAPIDDGTQKFKFTKRNDVDGLKIQAYYKVAGDTDWHLEDWTDKEYMSFCRDASDERLTDLVIVISNSSPDTSIKTTGAYYNQLRVSDIGCWRYSGTASMEMTGEGEGGAFADIQTLTGVTFERTDTHPNIPYPFMRFQVVSGQLNRTYDYQSTDGDCTGSGELNAALGPRNKYELYILYGGVLDSPSKNRYGGTSNADQAVTVDWQCENSPPPSSIPSLPWFYTDVLSEAFQKIYTVSSAGIMDGSYNMLKDTTQAQMNYKWHFESFTDKGGSGDSSTNNSSGSIPPVSGIIGQSTPPGGGNGSPTQLPPTGTPIFNANLSDIPVYPNIESSQQTQFGMLTMSTSDSVASVEKFYTEQLTALGWAGGALPSDPSSGYVQLNFTKDNRVLMIMLTTEDNKTMIMISQLGG